MVVAVAKAVCHSLALCFLGLEDRIFELEHGMQVRLRLHFARDLFFVIMKYRIMIG